MTRTTFVLWGAIGLLPIVSSGCATDSHVPRTPTPHITEEMPPRFDGGYHVGQAYVMTSAGDVTVGERLANFCLGISTHAGGARSVGCLPVVTYDLRREGPWVSELGVRLADDVAGRLTGAGYFGEVLSTPEMDARIQRSGQNKASFSSVAAVSANGPGLGIDVIVFGTMKRENNLGVNGRDVLTLDFMAIAVATGDVVAREQIEVASDREGNQTFFELAQRESLWLPSSP